MPIKDPDARREYQRKWIARRRAEWLAGKSCASCGAVDELEVDHIDPAQKVTHNVWGWSSDRRDAELAKCQVLCNPCHLKKTIAWQNAKPIPHGTDSGYTGRGCHCDACTEAHRLVKQAWRDARKAAGLPYT